MDWVFWAILGAAAAHVFEEYVWPGGFLAWFRTALPAFASAMHPPFAVVTNAVFLLLCLYVATAGTRTPILGLSCASLLAINAALHAIFTVTTGRYSPGVVTGVLVCTPIAVEAFTLSLRAGLVDLAGAVRALLLGAGYQMLVFVYFILSRAMTGRSGRPK